MNEPTDEQITMWYPQLFRTALRLTGSTETAGDVTQETFCKALAGWEKFDGRSLVTTWLHRILINCIRDRQRRQLRRSNMGSFSEWRLKPIEAELPMTDEEFDRRTQLVHLRKTIEKLPDRLRVAFIATALDGRTYEQAAELLSLPVGTIASRVHEARQIVQRRMRQAFPEVCNDVG